MAIELQEFGKLIDKPRIFGYIDNSFTDLERVRDNHSGIKQSYIDRAGSALNELKSALGDAHESNTSISVFQAIKTALGELEQVLNPHASENINFERLNELADIILTQIPLLGLTAFGTAKRRVSQELLDELTTEFRGYSDSKKEEISALIDTISKTVKREQDQLLKDNAAKKEKLDTDISRIERLAQLVSGKALSNEFTIQAGKHRTGKRIWTSITAASAVITLGYLGVFLFVHLQNQLTIPLPTSTTVDYSLITTKILITITLGLLTRWASKRANHHLAEQSRYDRLALNMDTLNSFVGDLDERNRNKVIAYVAAKTLSDYPSGEAEAAFDSISLGALIKEIYTRPTDTVPKVP